MLKKSDYDHYKRSHGLALSAIDYIDTVRNSEPSRMVGIHAKNNICSSIFSDKMGHTISLESRTAEKCFFLMSEYDDQVLEIWEQPQPVKIQRTDKNGISRPGSYTADFLLLTTNGPVVVEVKPEKTLSELTTTKPNDWICDSNNRFKYVPAVSLFNEIGVPHEIFCYKNNHANLAANIELLLGSRSAPDYDAKIVTSLHSVFDECFYWHFSALRERLDLKNYTPLIQLCDKRIIYGDIHKYLLSNPENFVVTQDPELLSEANKIVSVKSIYEPGVEEGLALDRVPSEKAARTALERIKIVNSQSQDRSARRWRAMVKNGQKIGLSPFQVLLSKDYAKGNRRTKVNDTVREFLFSYLRSTHSKSQGLSDYRSYIQYKNLATDNHPQHDPVCKTTFNSYLNYLPQTLVAKGRGGRRAENAAAEPTDPLSRSLKPQIPWASAAIDHYLADIYIVVYAKDDSVYVERPWISGMVDLCTNSIIAVTLSFKPPSRQSCAKIIRECVRNHGLLPKEIIVDRGSDFKSVYFDALLANYGVTNSQRPSAHSRYGGEIEGFFGDLKKQWLSQRAGNLADYKEARSVDGKMAPKNKATLQPGELYEELQNFCKWRDTKPRNSQMSSSSIRFNNKALDYPFMGIKVPYDNDFLIATSVDSNDYKVDFQRGIHIDENYYWTPKLTNIRGKRKTLQVRRDPENPEVIYALVEQRWEICHGSNIRSFLSLNKIDQFERGIIAIECANSRRKIREAMDRELHRDVQERNTQIQSRISLGPNTESDKELTSKKSLFSNLLDTPLQTLDVQDWEE